MDELFCSIADSVKGLTGGGVFHCDGEETGSLGALEENRGFLARVGEGFDRGNVQGDGEANSAPPIASDSRAA